MGIKGFRVTKHVDGFKAAERYFDIVNGPSKDLLFDACKYAYSKTAKISVDFRVVTGYTAPKNDPSCAYTTMLIKKIRIVGIEHENGSGESFNLHGHCEADLNSVRKGNAAYKSYRFKSCYNTQARKGYIILIEG